jgi:hypothetical protein
MIKSCVVPSSSPREKYTTRVGVNGYVRGHKSEAMRDTLFDPATVAVPDNVLLGRGDTTTAYAKSGVFSRRNREVMLWRLTPTASLQASLTTTVIRGNCESVWLKCTSWELLLVTCCTHCINAITDSEGVLPTAEMLRALSS